MLTNKQKDMICERCPFSKEFEEMWGYDALNWRDCWVDACKTFAGTDIRRDPHRYEGVHTKRVKE